MKNKKTWLIILITVLVGIVIGFSCVRLSRADSGWDTSYDSGSSYSSGSSWSNSSSFNDYNYSSSSTSGSEAIGMIVSMIALYVVLLIVYSNKKGYLKSSSNFIPTGVRSPHAQVSEEEMKKTGMTAEEFVNLAFQIYKDIQIAWMEFDYNKLRELTTDEVANSYIMQLDVLKDKKQKNIMENNNFIEGRVYNICEQNNVLNIDVFLNIEMYNYVVDKNNKVVRGDKNHKLNVEYEITFEKMISSNYSNSLRKCPTCGASGDINKSGKCEYCGSIFNTEKYDWTLTNIETV